MLTGRWPEAHHVRMKLQAGAAFFERDVYEVAKGQGYRRTLVGKNHTYLKKENLDVWNESIQIRHRRPQAGTNRLETQFQCLGLLRLL